jgi:hypothetical protein
MLTYQYSVYLLQLTPLQLVLELDRGYLCVKCRCFEQSRKKVLIEEKLLYFIYYLVLEGNLLNEDLQRLVFFFTQ